MIITYKALVFPVVRYSWESWTIKKEECQRIDAFKLWCWRRLLRVPWTARRSNQSILREINPEYSLEGLMPMLKLQYFGHLIQTADSLEKSLMTGKNEGRRREGHQRVRWLDSITDAMDMNLANFRRVSDREAGLLWSRGSQRVRPDWVTEQQHNLLYVSLLKIMIAKGFWVLSGHHVPAMNLIALEPYLMDYSINT